MVNPGKGPNVEPLRRQEVSVETRLTDDCFSLVQQYFMEYHRVDKTLATETPKEKNKRMTKYLQDLTRTFLNLHKDLIDKKHSLRSIIDGQKLRERILADRSLFIPRSERTIEDETASIEDIDIREQVYNEVFSILDHAWQALHSGFYAKDLEDLAERLRRKHRYWEGLTGKEKLEDMGLDVEKVLKDRTKYPVMFGPAEQLNPLPSLLTVDDTTDIIGSIEEANETIDRIIGMYIKLNQYLEKPVRLCLPTLIFDQVSSGGPTVNTHFHTGPGQIVEIVGNNVLKTANRLPMIALRLKLRPEEQKQKGKGKTNEVTVRGAIDEVKKYIDSIENPAFVDVEAKLQGISDEVLRLKNMFAGLFTITANTNFNSAKLILEKLNNSLEGIKKNNGKFEPGFNDRFTEIMELLRSMQDLLHVYLSQKDTLDKSSDLAQALGKLEGISRNIDLILTSIKNEEARPTEARLQKAKKFLAALESVYTQFADQSEVNYSEFMVAWNTKYMQTFFPNYEIPIEFIDEQEDGRFGNFMKYVTDMNKFSDFMVSRGFWKEEDELCLRVSLKHPSESTKAVGGVEYTKFARYYWDKEAQVFKVNNKDKMDSDSDTGKAHPTLTLDQVRDNSNFVAIPLKSIEYVSFAMSILPELVIIDDSVFFGAFVPIPGISKGETGEYPNYIGYRPLDPTQTGY